MDRMTNAELLKALDELRNTMVAVATGGPRIPEVNDRFRQTYALVAAALPRRGIENPLIYGDLWDWYGRWRSGEMPTYQSRRAFVGELFDGLSKRIRTGHADDDEPTGWHRVDRAVGELRDRLASASTEE